MGDQRVTYWAAQVRAIVTDDVSVTESHDVTQVVVELPDEGNTRKERANLIRSLERGGVRVVSPTRSAEIYVDATADPLPHPYDHSVAYE